MAVLGFAIEPPRIVPVVFTPCGFVWSAAEDAKTGHCWRATAEDAKTGHCWRATAEDDGREIRKTCRPEDRGIYWAFGRDEESRAALLAAYKLHLSALL